MSKLISKVACIGGGVIGGGWIARFLLNGIDVAVHDPSPDARRIVDEVLENARRAYARMLMAPLGPEGQLTFHDTLAAAVAGADYIQESVPERLDLKHTVIAAIEAAAPRDALIGSSTSGFRPSQLQEGMAHPERLFVAHPFNPVYLVPLVEIVGSPANTEAALDRAAEIQRETGLKPVRIRKEIDAHIGDRLLEAVWREALWLVHDDVATTEEIDDVIRFGFGLRWAQMGLFETYRIAGGEAGMKHFIEQFGPALKWPWTKLMDVPEMTDALAGKIGDQSDAQSGQHSIRELERIRDDNLIGILQALRANDWGAGETLREMEDRFFERAKAVARATETDYRASMVLHETRVPGEWLDYNGHMTEFRYLQVFGDATDAFLGHIGMDDAYRSAGRSVYTVETHIRHLAETKVNTRLSVKSIVLGHDAKRIRLHHEMVDEAGQVQATAEHMLMHVDTEAGRASPMAAPLTERLAALSPGQSGLEVPEHAGRPIRDIGWPEPEVS
ncbi:MAG: carnitine 3-dehydrogenase [Sulfitobacter litoralis]|jgi:carnitine 3-dehydrogenase|uniref:carnitine 3-dehydrogenase n=2 Tax=Roseobacteraceae TaxID=2854170 RepID=UPI001B4C48E7|nr:MULTISPECIES: carnitine 3-dehydrogenase [Sulfitobacter]MBQ0716586.1 carnitine 3-dehydrogenase [Sulfitobacter litoralis]MBQ0766162.1 carnitine 3-dehydrogenase [Sulfitobacter litoralis]MBQ0802150.1 carnitine 3-dehydrogenase [Sulfitobacter litoralis]MCF7728237.1 carnitine 3-dehydrogenase [Sulfitobacter sp. M22]MCF7779225.1 carnitine 3-dehydrogenase [Sulfitobacter sp. M220]|tara:strand:+ start:3734 stop:5239 length:1506 start_codon:yes stop_codon:yes gene_type:complete